MDADALAALADIEVPAPPEWGAAALAGLLLILVAAAIGAAAWHRLRRGQVPATAGTPPVRLSPAAEALVRLDALQEHWRAGGVDDREAGYRLCTLLRIGLTLPALDPSVPPAGIPRPEEWRRCLQRLQRLRYAARGETLAAEAFELARLWLASTREAAPRHA